ncbi:MAG: hypothetical protein GX575_07460, partial [Candidatus Anammoximicrobium sp.]|nr:hypothetical protein [Candidatus Anammoximicrobium sp.]
MTSRKTMPTLRDKNQSKKSRSNLRGRRVLEQLEDRRLLAGFDLQGQMYADSPGFFAGGEQMGHAVAVAEDLAVIAIPHMSIPAAMAPLPPDTGVAIVQTRNDNGTPDDQSDDSWGGDPAILLDENLHTGDAFGLSVGIDGNTVVIGAPGDDEGASDAGAAYVFVFDGGTWTQQAKLIASGAEAGAALGSSVDISGDTIVVGAPGEDASGADSGAAYVFVRDAGAWTQQTSLVAADAEAGDAFGTSVAISPDQVVVGAPLEDGAGTDRGAMYRFLQSGGVWDAGAKYTQPDVEVWDRQTGDLITTITPQDGDRFGQAVDTNGMLVVVGAPGEPGVGTGTVHIFADMGGGFGAFYSPNSETDLELMPGWNYGAAVAVAGVAPDMSDLLLAVGIPNVVAPGEVPGGAVQIIQFEAAPQFLLGDGAEAAFGTSVSVSGQTILVGAPLQDNTPDGGPTLVDSGAAFFYGPAATGPAKDWGDAPDSDLDYGPGWYHYATLAKNDGANHLLTDTGPYLGAGVTAEDDGRPWGEEANGDEDDGVTFSGPLLLGQQYTVQVTVSADCKLDAWVDFDFNNGRQFDAGDQIFDSLELASGTHDLTFTVPLDAQVPSNGYPYTYARFRVSTAGGLDPWGPADDGEVEDYRVAIEMPPRDYGDAGWPYATSNWDNGPWHAVGSLSLGALVDAEEDGSTEGNSVLDDNTGLDDEDGVTFANPLVVGETGQVVVTSSGAGFLDAWIDFSRDGTFVDDPNEQIAMQLPIDGELTIEFAVPSGAQINWDGTVQTRFRLSSVGGLSPNGPAADGEVEDHRVELNAHPVAQLHLQPGGVGHIGPGELLMTTIAGSESNDPNDWIDHYDWDLDGDGQFDDYTNTFNLDHSFEWETFAELGLGAGIHTIGVRAVNQNSGLTGDAFMDFELEAGCFDVLFGATGGTYHIRRDGDELVFSDPTAAGGERRWQASLLTDLSVRGQSNNDTLVVDFSGGDPIPGNGLFFDGWGMDDFDTLEIVGGDFDTIEHDLIRYDSGQIDFGPDVGTLTYAGLEPIHVGATANNQILNLPGASVPYGPSDTLKGGVSVSASAEPGGLQAGTAIGRSGTYGVNWKTFTYTGIDPTGFDTQAYWGLTSNHATGVEAPWGFDQAISLDGYPNASGDQITASNLNLGASSLANGVAVWERQTLFTTSTSGTYYVPVRLMVTVTRDGVTPLPLRNLNTNPIAGLNGHVGVVLDLVGNNVTQFRAEFRMLMYHRSAWRPLYDEYDYIGTPSGQRAYTSTNSSFWFDSAVARLQNNTASGYNEIVSDVGAFEYTTFQNPSQSLTVNADGFHEVQLYAMDTGFSPQSMTLSGASTDTFLLTANHVIPDNTDLQIGGSATFDMDGHSDVVGGLSGTGSITTGGGTLRVGNGDGAGDTATFSGAISESGGLQKYGAGTQILSGNNSYSGSNFIEEGTLLVNGTNSGGGAVYVKQSATLGGTGTIAGAVALCDHSHLSPGTATSIGSLAVGSVWWQNVTTFFDVEIDGTAGAGVTNGHDMLSVGGGVTLGNTYPTLAIDLGFSPSPGDSFTIIDKTGGGAISGTFKDLPEGTVFSVTTGSYSATFQITYQGGDGNDVVLTTLSATAPALTGTPGGDYFVVKKNGSNVEVYQGTTSPPTTLVYSAALSGLTTLTIDGLAGNDSVSVDFSTGNALPSGGLTFHGAGQTGTPGDVLHIVGGTQGDVVYNYTNAHDGSIVLQNYGTINYTGLEPISNSGSATNLVFNLPGGGDQARLKNLGGGTLRLESTAGVPTFEQTDFATPSGSITINSDGNADLLNVLGTFDYNPAGGLGGEMDVNPNGDLVYISAGMGQSGLIRVNASFPGAMTSNTLAYGAGVAVDPVTGRYATTDGAWNGNLYVYNSNDTLYDTEGLTGCGGSLAAGNGTFGISTQCTDRFHIYNEATASISLVGSGAVGSQATYNGATSRYYWNLNPGSAAQYFTESPPAYVATLSGYFVREANPLTNRLYAINTGTNSLQVLNGTTHAVIATVGAGGDTAVDTALDRLYFVQGGAISVYNGSGTSLLGTITLPDGYTANSMDMAVGDDRLYVLAWKSGVTNQRLFVMQTGAGVAPGNDLLTVDQSGGDAIPAGGVIYNGGDGDDKLSVDLNGNANYLSANSITFNGGGQTSGDSIEVLNTPNVSGRGTDYIADTSGTANSGRIVVNPGGGGGAGDEEMKIYFTGLEPSTVSGSGPLDVIVNVDATTTVDVKDVGASNDGWNVVDGNSTFEDVTFSGFTTLNVYSGNGAETITLHALDSTSPTTINLSGDNFAGTDAGNDTFNIQATVAATVNLIGGAGDDTFVFSAGQGVTGTITGGGQSDTLDYGAYTTPVSVTLTGTGAGTATGTGGFTGIESVKGGTASDTLTGQNATSTWNITGSNAGNVTGLTSFQGFENLTGGSGSDTFTFANAGALAGAVTGGPGMDTLVGDPDGNAFVVTGVDMGTLTGKTSGWSGIENLTGAAGVDTFTINSGATLSGNIDGQGGNDTLAQADGTNSWNITSANGGTVTDLSGTFSNIENVTGGNGPDTFYLVLNTGSLTGAVTGGAGTDRLVGDSTGNAFVVTGADAGTLTGKTSGWSGIEELFGHGGVDTFTINSGATLSGIIDGQGGNDTLAQADGSNSWNITSANGGTVSDVSGTFSNIENLTGGTGSDNFAFGGGGSLSGNLNGGAGSNTLDYSSYGGVTVDLDSGSAPGVTGSVSNIQNFLGSSLNDILSVDALALGVTRNVNGGGGAGNVLYVDAKGQTATDNGSQITFGGGYGTITYSNFQTVNITGAALTITGDGNNNTLTVTADTWNSGHYQLDSGPVVNFSGVTSFQFDGLAGNDTLIINNPANSVFGPTGGITFNGGPQTVADTLTLAGGGGAGFTETYTVGPAVDEGTIVTTNGTVTQTIHFTGLEPINDTVMANLDIYATDAANTIQVVNGTAGRVQVTIDAFEAMDFSNKTNVTVHGGDSTAGGDGIDTITVDFTNSASGLASLTVNADDANDVIEVKNTANNISLAINGNAGSDSLSFTTNPLSLSAGAGLTLSVGTTETIDVNQDLTALGGITFANPTWTYLGASLQTDGTDVSITGNTVMLDGAAVVIDTESNNAGNAGNVSLGNTSIRPDVAGHDLTIDAQGGVGGNGGTVTLGILTNTAGAFVDDLSIDANGVTDGNVILNQSVQTAGSILIQNAVTVDINGDVTAGTTLTIQNATTVDLGANVDLAAGGALSVSTNVTAINLSGATGTTNAMDGNGNASVTLASITATFSPHLTVNSEGAVSMASANIGATGSINIAVDNNNNGSEPGTFGALSAGSLAITGSSGNNDITFNGPGTSIVATSVSVTGAGAIDVNAKITAGTTVVMTASDNISIDAAIDPTTVTLTSDDDVLVNAPVSATTLITVQAGQDGSGSLSVTASGSMTTTAAGSDIDVTVGATSGGISLAGNVTTQDRLTLTSNATSANGGGVSQTVGTVAAPNLQLYGSSGAFALAQATNNFGTVAAALDGGSVNLTDTNSVTVGAVVTSGIDTGSSGNGGAVTVNATSGTITVNQAIDTSTGASGGVSISGSVVINAALIAGGGNITLNGNPSGAFDLDINAPITSALTINLTAPRDILVGAKLETTGGAGAHIILTADSDGDSVGGVRIEAAGQLVSDDQVQLTGSDLWVVTAWPYDSVLVDGDMTIGTLQIDAGGAVLIQDGANAPAAADTIIDGVIRTTGATATIAVTAEQDVRFGDDGDLSGVGGTVTVTADTRAGANGGVIDMTALTTINAGSGLIDLNADGNIDLTGLTTTGEVQVTTDNGAITDAGDTNTDVTAATAALRALTGIGSDADDLDTAANGASFTVAAVTESGDIHLSNTGALIVNTVNGLSGVTISDAANDNSRNDNIILRANSPETVDAGDPVVNHDGGNIILAAQGSATTDDLTLYDNVTVTGGDGTIDGDGNIYLYAGDTIDLAVATVVVSVDASGTVLVSAGTNYNGGSPLDGNSGGDVLMTSGASVTSADANITIRAPNNVQLSVVDANSNGSGAVGDVIVTADYAGPGGGTNYPSNNIGAISDNLTGEGANITGDEVALRAGSGIGDGVAPDDNDLDLAIARLAAVTVSGDIHVQNSGNLEIYPFDSLAGVAITDAAAPLNSGGDHITIRAGGWLGVATSNPVVNNDGGNITLAAEGAELTIAADVTVTGGDPTIDGIGNIYLYANRWINLLSSGVDVTTTGAGSVLLSAGTNYNNGSPVDGESSWDVMMTSGSSVRSEDGNITVLAPDDVQLSILNANSDGDGTLGDVIVTADYAGPGGGTNYPSNNVGAISDNLTGEAANITGDQVALRAGSGIGDGVAPNDADIDVAINTLAAVTVSGDIHVQDLAGGLTIDTFDGLSGVTITDAVAPLDSGNDHITIRASSPLTVSAGDPVVNNDGGNIVLAAEGTGTGDDLTLDDNVTATGGSGNISLYAGDTISLTGTITVSAAGTGAVLGMAGTNYANGSPANGTNAGDVSMADGTTIQSADGNISLRAPGNVSLSIVNADSNGSGAVGDVIVTADYAGVGGGLSNNTGAISDNLTGEAANITGDQVALRAGSGIGDGVAPDDDDIDVAINTLAAVTVSGDIHVQDLAGGLTIDSFDSLSGVTITDAVAPLDSGNDHITIRASSPLTVSAGDPVVNNDGGNIVLAAKGTGTGDDLTLDDNVTVTGGDGAIDGDGNIYLYAGDTIDLAAATVVVSADASGTVLLSAG